MISNRLKAQISIFLIIALISIFLIAYLYNFEYNEVKEETTSIELFNKDQTKESIKLFLDSCYEISYYNALQNIGFHGGIFNQEDLIENNVTNQKYTPYLINNISTVPTLSEIKSQFEKAINYYFPICLNLTNDFNLSYDVDKISTSVNLRNDNQIQVNSNLLISFQGSHISQSFDSFSFSDSYSYLIKYLEISNKIVNQSLKNPNQICLTCNLRLEKEYGIEIFAQELISENVSGVIYHLINNNLEYNDVSDYSFLQLINGGNLE